ncbi:hypothetical protein ACV357_32875, partial [Pseudomonas aeruginosa]
LTPESQSSTSIESARDYNDHLLLTTARAARKGLRPFVVMKDLARPSRIADTEAAHQPLRVAVRVVPAAAFSVPLPF